MKKYQNKYRIPSARASWWDYGWNAVYFITICTKDRECWFGKIIESKDAAIPKKMDLAAMGHIANSCWHEIPNHFPFVELGAHIIMPNHLHGILIINKPNDERNDFDVGHIVNVETQNIASLQPPPQRQNPPSRRQQPSQSHQPPTPSSPKQSSEPPNADTSSQQSKSKTVQTENDQPKNQFGPQSQNLASIIRGFKIGVTKNAREINREFAWQSRYHDHIIRDEKSYHNISTYIINNPLKWQEDKFYNT